MFSPDHLDFHFPLFTTSLHILVQFLLASTVLYFIPSLRPRVDSLDDPKPLPNEDDDDEPPHPETRRLMTPQFYLTRIGPCGAATGLDIGLGNMSLKFITLTFFSTLSFPGFEISILRLSYSNSFPIILLPPFPSSRPQKLTLSQQCANPPP